MTFTWNYKRYILLKTTTEKLMVKEIKLTNDLITVWSLIITAMYSNVKPTYLTWSLNVNTISSSIYLCAHVNSCHALHYTNMFKLLHHSTVYTLTGRWLLCNVLIIDRTKQFTHRTLPLAVLCAEVTNDKRTTCCLNAVVQFTHVLWRWDNT